MKSADADQYEALKDKQTPEVRSKSIRHAVREYAGEHSYFVDATNATYDAVDVEDTLGRQVRRWGYYSRAESQASNLKSKHGAKRKAEAPSEKGRKLIRPGSGVGGM